MISERTKAILLFTSYFLKDNGRTFKPLSITEWNRFARWQQTKSLSPEDFLTRDCEILLKDFQDKTITFERIYFLLERKSSLAIALDKWTKAGIWIINRGDKDYPKSVKELLKENVPPILFGIGNMQLLNKKFIGVVGSRDANVQELNDTRKLAQSFIKDGYGVVSGAAKGVDEWAMMGALESHGFSLGYVADSLIKKSTSSLFRKHIINKNLCLVSPYNPEAVFNVGNAMSRNKLIYTQSSATIVVKSDIKGGTWEGAKENLKNNWVPVWVLDYNVKGNIELAKKGARKLTFFDEINLLQLTRKKIVPTEPDLFTNDSLLVHKEMSVNESAPTYRIEELKIKIKEASFFDLFIAKFNENYQYRTVSKKEIKEDLRLTTSQLDEWLKLSIEKNYLIKKNKPVSFKFNPNISIKIEL